MLELQILDIIDLICACIWLASPYFDVRQGEGYAVFVTAYGFVFTLFFFFFHLFRIINKLAGPCGLIELIYYGLCSLMMLIARIVAAVQTVKFARYYEFHITIGATAFSTFPAFVVYLVDIFLLLRGWRSSGTTTSQTTSEKRTQY